MVLIEQGKIIRYFDPWKSKICSCPLKFNLNPYTGCGHGCIYCYARTYIKNFDRPRPKKNLIKDCLSDLSKIPKGIPISLSNSSDPYTPPEAVLGLTRRVIKLLINNGYPLLIITKSDLVLRDINILRKGNVVVSITVTTLDESISNVIEPNAPPPSNRIKALSELSESGVTVTARIDPIIPYVNDDETILKNLVRSLANAGVIHITASTLKVKPVILHRISMTLPTVYEKLRDLYKAGERVSSYVYLPRDLRLSYLLRVKELCESEGISFATCRESLDISTPGITCDGSTYLNPQIKI